MIFELLAVAAGVAAGGLVGAWVRRRRRSRARRLAPAPARPRHEGDVRIGDAVLHLGEDFLVIGEARFEEQGRLTFESYTTETTERTRFLLREDDGKRSSWLTAVDPPVRGHPPDRVRVGEDQVRLEKRGRAKAASRGETRLPNGDVEYLRYVGPGRRVVWVIVAGSETTWLSGEEVLPGMVEVLPAS